MSSYYHVDFEAAEVERRLTGSDVLTAPIVEALNDLVCARRDADLALADWMASMRAATERALRRLDRHIRVTTLPQSPFRAIEKPGELGYGLDCEHELLRSTLFDQLVAATPDHKGPLAGRAAHLLDLAIDSECLLAVHLNGIGRVLRQLAETHHPFRAQSGLGLVAERAS